MYSCCYKQLEKLDIRHDIYTVHAAPYQLTHKLMAGKTNVFLVPLVTEQKHLECQYSGMWLTGARMENDESVYRRPYFFN